MEQKKMKIKFQFSPLLKVVVVLLAILFILGVGLIVSYYSDSGAGIREVTITNLTSNGATISWVTDSSSKGNVIYSQDNTWLPFYFEKNGKSVAYDDRDVDANSSGKYVLTEGEGTRVTHHVTLRNLEPNKTYYFKVGNGNRYFQGDISTFTTTTVIEELQVPDPVYGRIKNHVTDGKAPQDGIIYYYVYNNSNPQDKSLVYSTTINDIYATWTGDLGLLSGLNGEFYSWKIDTHRLKVDAKTEVGYGTQDYTLNEYKPLPTLDVNVRYLEK